MLITLPRCSFRTSLSGVVVWGLGRSPNSKNLCASLRPLCGYTLKLSPAFAVQICHIPALKRLLKRRIGRTEDDLVRALERRGEILQERLRP